MLGELSVESVALFDAVVTVVTVFEVAVVVDCVVVSAELVVVGDEVELSVFDTAVLVSLVTVEALPAVPSVVFATASGVSVVVKLVDDEEDIDVVVLAEDDDDTDEGVVAAFETD